MEDPTSVEERDQAEVEVEQASRPYVAQGGWETRRPTSMMSQGRAAGHATRPTEPNV